MASPNNTFASPGNSFYALSSESAKNWYTFPSLNGQVLLQDASGIQVLDSVGGDLFFNQELLAKASDIQDISEWSDYPVLNPAGVDFNGNPLTNASTITASGDISGGAALSITDAITAGSLTVSNGINTLTSSISTSGLSTNNTIPGVNQIVTGSVVTESIEATTGATLKGASLSDALDMTNNPINRASSINLSNAGFAPYGQLTSNNGTQLLWNGATINTGAAGSAAGWANFPAVAPIQGNGQPISNVTTVTTTGDITTPTSVRVGANVLANTFAQIYDASGNNALKIQAQNPSGLLVTSFNGGIASVAAAGKIESTATGDVNLTTSGGNVNVTSYNNFNVDSGNDINMTADAGINPIVTPTVEITAQNGNGGRIDLVANAGVGVGPAQIGYGVINLKALGAANGLFNLGGAIDLTAYSGGLGDYGGATSRVSASAATIALSAGAAPVLPGLAGSMNIFGQGLVSIVSSLIPPVLPQFPNTVFIYGDGIPGVAGGVRIQSPQGIQMLSDLYATDIYPLSSGGLNLKGRASFPGPAADVTIADCASIAMRNAGTITGVTSINGVPYPPPAGLVEDWSTYKAVSAVDLSGQGINNVGDLSGVVLINGSVYPPVVSSADWYLFPAGGPVDLSANSLNAVGAINTVAGAAITSAGALSIFADTSGGNLTLATNGGGDVNIGTGNAGDINIATGGAGNELTLAGDIVNLDATLGIRMSNALDMTGNNIINVAQLNGSTATTLNINSGGLLDMVANGNANVTSSSGSVVITSVLNADITSSVADVNITGETGVNLISSGPITINTATINVTGADIQNVSNITNDASNLLTVQSTANLTVSAETALTLVSDSADVTVQGQTGITVYAATGDVNITADSGEVIVQDSVLNMNTHKITNVTNGTAAADAVNYGQLTFRDQTEFYVSGQGSDSNNGSILAPFLTIQAAITAAELISSASQICVINVASGIYVENLTFNKGYVCLNGSLQSQTGNEVCKIQGSINIAVAGASDLFNRQINFSGFNITCNAGQAVNDTSTTPHVVSVQDCKIFAFNQFFVSTSSAPDMRLYLTNVEIQQTNAASTLPIITTNIGQLEFERLDMSVAGNCSAIVVGGTSILSRFSLSALESTNASATLAPLVSITSNTLSTHTFGNVALAFSSATTKSNTSAIFIASGVNSTLLMLNTVYSLQGTSASTNYCVGYDGSGNPAILGVNNTSLNVNILLPQTTAIQTAITQIAYTDTNPPVMACYSTTGDQTITAVNTPQAVTFNTTQFNQGTALVASSRFYVSSQGNYQITWSLMMSHASGTALMTSFLKKNGTTVANTGSQTTTFSGSTSIVQVSPNFILSLNAGDYVELFVASNAIGSTINSTGAINGNPATPGAVFNITQIR